MLVAAALLAVWQAAAYAAVASAVSITTGASSTPVIIAQLLLLGLGAAVAGLALPLPVTESTLAIAAGALVAGAAIIGSILLGARWRLAFLEPSVAAALGATPPRICAGLFAFAVLSMVIAAALRTALEVAATAWSPLICALALPPIATIGCAAAASGAELLLVLVTTPLPATLAGLAVAVALALILQRSRETFS